MIDSIILSVLKEVDFATSHRGPFVDRNHAAGVLREEYLEAEQELFHGSVIAARQELIQVAAVAIKAISFLDSQNE